MKLAQTFKYSFRQLRKSPGFTLTAILTLGLGIGANIAVFSVMNAVLVNPSGIPHPDRVAALRAKYAMGDLANISMSAPDMGDAASATNLMSSVAAMQQGSFNYSEGGSTPVKLNAAMVTWQWLDVFAVKPILGRSFRPEEDLPNANREVVLAYKTWKERFSGDPNIIGRKLMLNEQPYEVVGVTGPEFNWPNTAELWAPLGLKPELFHDANFRYNENLFVIGRMRDGVTIEQVNAYLATKSNQQIASEGTGSYGKVAGWGMFSMPLIEFVSGSLRKPLVVLISAVALVLLIACANIAGLQLARASGRQREVSIQIALGAGKGRLLKQALAESVLLAVSGVVLGLLIAEAAIPALMAIAPMSLAPNLSVSIDATVLAFVAAVSIACVLFCGIAPAWQMTHVRWFQSLQEGGRSETSSRARQRTRSALVIVEIALAMLLLTGAGLLVRSLERLQQVETGFDPKGVVSAVVSLPRTKYDTDPKQAAFASAVEEQLRRQPGVTDVGMSDNLPFMPNGGSASFTIVGRPQAPNDPGPHGNIRVISPGYFSTLRIPVLRGRAFTDGDRKETQQVAVIDDVLAKQYWPNQDPIGQYISFGGKSPKMQIVGVVSHARNSSLESDGAEGFYFLAVAQTPSPNLAIAVRTTLSNPSGLASELQNAVRNVDPNQPIYDVKLMTERVEDSLVSRRFLVVLLSIFAGLALLLSALGLYGVINYGVKLRVREIGIRMALGAQRMDVLRLILQQGVRLAAVGLVLGVFAVFIAGRALSSMLYQVSLYNPITLMVTTLLLASTVLLASYLPARRAAQTDPIRTLRDE